MLVLSGDHLRVQWMSDLLQSEGYFCHCVKDSSDVVETVRSIRPSLIFMDTVENSNTNFTQNVSMLSTFNIPILVTASAGNIDYVSLMDRADDFICAPVNPQELLFRVRKLLTHRPSHTDRPPDAELRSHDFGIIHGNGRRLALTRTESQILRALVLSKGRALSRDYLLARLHIGGRQVADRSIDSHVKNLRRKLKEVGYERCVQSVYGVGFRIDQKLCPVTMSERSAHTPAESWMSSGVWDGASLSLLNDWAREMRDPPARAALFRSI